MPELHTPLINQMCQSFHVDLKWLKDTSYVWWGCLFKCNFLKAIKDEPVFSTLWDGISSLPSPLVSIGGKGSLVMKSVRCNFVWI